MSGSRAGGPIRIVVADDHALFREGITAILRREPDFDVVGEAGDGPTAVSRCRRLQPDVVLLDVAMPGLNGIEAIGHIRADSPATGIVMLTMLEEDAPLTAALRAGARGYLLKGSTGAEVARTVRAVAAGEARFGADVAARLPELVGAPAPTPLPELTDRERQILALVADGLGNAAIGRRLAISAKTVANHVSNVLLKLQVPDRSAAALAARRAGLGSVADRHGRTVDPG